MPALLAVSVALVAGVAVCWVVEVRRRRLALARAAREHDALLIETDAKLRAATERLGEVERESSAHETLARDLGTNCSQLRSELDAMREERAQLRERLTRIPELEAELRDSRQRQGADQTEIRRLATSEAERLQIAVSAESRRQSSEAEIARLRQELSTTSEDLREVSTENASLQSQLSRLQTVEDLLTEAQATIQATERESADLRERFGVAASELKAERDGTESLRAQVASGIAIRDGLEVQLRSLTADLADLRARSEIELRSAGEKLMLLDQAKQILADQFKVAANEILEDKSKRFTEQNQLNLGQLLTPLKQKIDEFQTKVEDVYVKEGKDRSALSEQVRQLIELNQLLGEEAKSLTRALKGSNKTQGNWGELVLERVLEASGLRKGEEYTAQASHVRDDGTRAVVDVVIRLPEDRNLVVDSKVSLTAYEEFCSAEDEAARTAARKRHLDSVRAHIKELSGKNYQTLLGLRSLDFVLMFVAVEPAFMLAITEDSDVFMEAWTRNVLLVSPSTLLFVVRTVAHLWRQEAQNRNAQEIAKRGGDLYDKFVGFVGDLASLGKRLRQAQEEYDEAYGKLAGGRGNLIRQAEKLRELGVKPSRSLPTPILETAVEELPIARIAVEQLDSDTTVSPKMSS